MAVTLSLLNAFSSSVSSSPLTDASKFDRTHNALKLDHISNNSSSSSRSSSSSHGNTNMTYGHEWDCNRRVIGYGEIGKR